MMRSWSPYVLILWISLGLTVLWNVSSQAQENLGIFPPSRPAPEEPKFPREPDQPALRRPELPPIPQPAPEGSQQLPLSRVFVRQIRIIGSNVFSQETLAAIAEPYINRHVTMEALEALRRALTRLYVNAGYINSGAVLPDQTITHGVVTFRIIEGTLTNVTFAGKRWFRDTYLRRRLTLGVEPPLNITVLQSRLHRLQQDDRIERLDAEFKPGLQPGESELHVQVTEHFPFFVALEFNNYQAATIGAERGLLTVGHRNVTGHGDIWTFTYGRSAGLELQIDTHYTLPLTPQDTTVSLRYQRNNSSVIADAFDPLDIESESETWTFSLRHPFYRDLRRELALSLSGERSHSESSLLGIPFSFTPGTENGEATATTLSVIGEWSDRTPTSILAIESRFSLGVDALGATINDNSDISDGRFLAWLGQLQWARRFIKPDLQARFRLTVQLTTEPLLPSEQIAIGGRFSVRGYRENQIVRDNGLLVSVETLVPLVRNKAWADFVHVVPFFDFGRGWNRKVETPDPTNLASIGLGVRWAFTVRARVPIRLSLDVWWGQKLLEVETEGGNLQDKGFHLQFVISSA